MKRIVGVLLIAFSIFLGYSGVQKLQGSSKSIEILGAELSVEKNDSKTQAYVFIGLSVVSFIGGVFLVSQGKSS